MAAQDKPVSNADKKFLLSSHASTGDLQQCSSVTLSALVISYRDAITMYHVCNWADAVAVGRILQTGALK